MPTISLPAELVDHILSYVQKQETLAICARVVKLWLPIARSRLYRTLKVDREKIEWPGEDGPLLLALRSYSELAALVHSLEFTAWYSLGSDELTEEAWSDDEEELLKATKAEEPLLGRFLGCCTRLRSLDVEGGSLWIVDLIKVPNLLSLSLSGSTRLRSRASTISHLTLPRIKHFSGTRWRPSIEAFDGDRSWELEEPSEFEDLGQLNGTLFKSLTHLELDSHLHLFTSEAHVDAIRHLAPQLVSLALRGTCSDWKPILPLCTSLRQTSLLFYRTEEADIIPSLPANLKLIKLLIPRWSDPEHSALLPEDFLLRVVGCTSSLLKQREGLCSFEIAREQRGQAYRRAGIRSLERVCQEKGISLRSRLWVAKEGDLVVEPRVGNAEVRWTEFRC